MEFQKLADSFFSPTCIVSVEKIGDDSYGAIRLVAGNKKYTDMINRRTKPGYSDAAGQETLSFVPGTLYTDYFPKSISFEEVCFQAAILKKDVHTYAHINSVDMWFDIYGTPLDFSDGDLHYCVYSSIPNQDADVMLDAFNTSRSATAVLKTCIKLHKASNLKEAMENVIHEIRIICKAKGCTVLLLNNEEEEYSILATSYIPNSNIKRVTEFQNFYDIANSWKEMLGDEGDCIIVRNQEDMENVGRINHPWYLTLVEAGVNSVVLFPLRQGNELLGFIWATNFDTENTQQIKETLELTTFFLSSHIARYKVLKRLEKMSYSDALTGLPNGFACTDHINELVSRGENVAAVSVDLNNFKSVNDTLGFEAGNRVLTEVSERWKTVFAKNPCGVEEYLARIGGDEFFIVVSGYRNENELEIIISRYISALSESLTIFDYDLYVSASFGYATYPTDADSTDALMSRASAAMREIKKANSSEHVLRFTRDILRDERILEIENKIRSALDNDTIYFNLQPQFNTNHELRGFEALARMKDTDGNFISAGEFIPVAEKVGLIDRLDGMVFHKAAMFFGELLRKTGVNLSLSINASTRHLMKRDFLDEIRTLLKDSGIPTTKLEIEITESIMIDSDIKALDRINELKEMGIQIAIDDFGTGYSSLSYLHKLPANILKIDKSFIDKMNTSDSSRQYVAAIISIGHVMGFDVISEGVEEQDQLETLKEIGCDFIQGFIWGRPLSAEDAEKLVTDSIK